MKKTTILLVTLLLSLSATAFNSNYYKREIKKSIAKVKIAQSTAIVLAAGKKNIARLRKLKSNCKKTQRRYNYKLKVLQSRNFSEEEKMKRQESLNKMEDTLEKCYSTFNDFN